MEARARRSAHVAPSESLQNLAGDSRAGDGEMGGGADEVAAAATDGSWSCHLCTSVNAPRRRWCAICGRGCREMGKGKGTSVDAAVAVDDANNDNDDDDNNDNDGNGNGGKRVGARRRTRQASLAEVVSPLGGTTVTVSGDNGNDNNNGTGGVRESKRRRRGGGVRAAVAPSNSEKSSDPSNTSTRSSSTEKFDDDLLLSSSPPLLKAMTEANYDAYVDPFRGWCPYFSLSFDDVGVSGS